MTSATRTTVALAFVLAAPTAARADAAAAGLGGSLASMARQHAAAVQAQYTFAATAAQADAQVARGRLARVRGNADFAVDAQVAHPYARAEVVGFIERLAADYRAATGERLVVTSLLRPRAEQPANAHRLSVHPAGMAVDLRVPAGARTRAWLERALLSYERAGVVDATRERRPAHYHVAVFPAAFRAFAAGDTADTAAAIASAPVVAPDATLEAPVAAPVAAMAPAPARAERVSAPVTVAAAPTAPAGARTGLAAFGATLAAAVAGATVAHRRLGRTMG